MAEMALIERIAAGVRLRPGTSVGIGDDAAVLEAGPRAVLTQDILVEGVHFRRATASAADIGHKALAANLCDIAAMAAEPVAALVGLVLPPETPSEAEIDAIYAGMEALAARHAVTVAGGDLVSGPVLVLSVTALGRLPDGRAPLLRSGGRAGDALCVTGALGAAAAGLLLLEDPALAEGVPEAGDLRAAHLRPEPRLAAARRLAAGGARALMDVSDGLALDALRMARASGLRAVVDLDLLPLAGGVAAVAVAAGRDPEPFAAAGGEDYELLAAVPPGRVAALAASLDLPLTPVGRLEEGEPGLSVRRAGAEVTLDSLGWEHGR